MPQRGVVGIDHRGARKDPGRRHRLAPVEFGPPELSSGCGEQAVEMSVAEHSGPRHQIARRHEQRVPGPDRVGGAVAKIALPQEPAVDRIERI